MIHINHHDITGVYSGSRDIVAVYSGLRLVWSKLGNTLLSCYSNGYWIDEYPWLDDLQWAD